MVLYIKARQSNWRHFSVWRERGSPKCTHGETHTCTLVQNCTAGCETRVRSRKVCVLASMATHSHEMQRTTQFSHAIQRGFFFFSFNVVKKAHHTLLTLLGKHPLCCSFSFARPVHSSHTHRHIWSTVKQSPSCLSRSCPMSKRKSPSIPEELQHTFVRRLSFF